MKTKIFYIMLLGVSALLTACDENESVPPFETLGSATSTVATITVSKAAPAPNESVTLTLKFVNLASDPIQQLVLKAKVGAAEYVEVQTFNESSAAQGAEITHEVSVTAPATSATTVIYQMELTSSREYPLLRRVQIRTP
jgi:hypothetical protein